MQESKSLDYVAEARMAATQLEAAASLILFSVSDLKEILQKENVLFRAEIEEILDQLKIFSSTLQSNAALLSRLSEIDED